jgi:kynurenine formamidase
MKEKDERALVSVEDIERWEETHGRIGEGEMVLFNYGWENRWRAPSGVENQPYLRDYPGLSKEAAEYLVNKGVKLVGSDTPSIDSYADPEEKAHRVLLPRRVLILENAKGLDLLPPRGALLMALPLKIKGGTGSPVRAVAFVPREASAQSKQ